MVKLTFFYQRRENNSKTYECSYVLKKNNFVFFLWEGETEDGLNRGWSDW